MNIEIRTVTNLLLNVLCVDQLNTVFHLKTLVEALNNLPVNHQRMVFNGAFLSDAQTLEHYQIHHQSTVYVVLNPYNQ